MTTTAPANKIDLMALSEIEVFHLARDTDSARLLVRLYQAFAKNDEIAREIAANECCPGVLLDSLADNADFAVRAAVAKHAKIQPHTLERLLNDPFPGVRHYAANNPAAYTGTNISGGAR